MLLLLENRRNGVEVENGRKGVGLGAVKAGKREREGERRINWKWNGDVKDCTKEVVVFNSSMVVNSRAVNWWCMEWLFRLRASQRSSLRNFCEIDGFRRF